MTTTGTVCAACGAENLGTRFCESCGTPAAPAQAATPAPALAEPASPASAVPAAVPATVEPAAAAPADAGRAPRGLAAAAYLLGIAITTGMDIAASSGSYPPEGAYTAVTSVTAVVVGLLMLIAAGVGTASGPGKAMGALLAIAYPATVIIQATVPYGGYDAVTPHLVPLLAPLVLFLSWGAGRPFRGPGYGAVLVVAVLGFASQFVSPAIGGYAQYAILYAAVLATSLAIVVLLSNAFEGTVARDGRRVETLARVALALVLAPFILNGIAGSISGAGVAGYVLIILLLIVAIIVGHVAFVRAGRSGNRGRGLAATALVVGYLVLIANTVVLIWLATFLASLSSLYGGY